MLYYVYAIKSLKDDRIYVGLSKNVNLRVAEHNTGRTKSTKGFLPWILIYQESVGGRTETRRREKYLKSGIGKEFLKLIRDSKQ